MKLKATATFIYGLLVFVGGIMGYVKAQSLPSLIMGSFFGLVLMVNAFALYKKSVLAHFASVGLTTILLLFFAFRLFKTMAFMPSGMMLILSMAMLGVLFAKRQKPVLLKD